MGKAKGVQFLVWDVGGQEKLRPLWRSYTRLVKPEEDKHKFISCRNSIGVDAKTHSKYNVTAL